MSTAESIQLSDVLERVKTWPPMLRITLARRILESVDAAEPGTHSPRGLSAAELRSLLTIEPSPPDDAAVRQWIDEHRMEKYG